MGPFQWKILILSFPPMFPFHSWHTGSQRNSSESIRLIIFWSCGYKSPWVLIPLLSLGDRANQLYTLTDFIPCTHKLPISSKSAVWSLCVCVWKRALVGWSFQDNAGCVISYYRGTSRSISEKLFFDANGKDIATIMLTTEIHTHAKKSTSNLCNSWSRNITWFWELHC